MCLAPYRHELQSNVSVPIWPHSISALIQMVFHAPPRMQRALVGAKRLECGSLLPLCLVHKQRVCPHIGIRGVSRQASATSDWSMRQFAGHAAIRGQHPNNEPVPLFVSLSDLPGWEAARTESTHLPPYSVAKGRSGDGAANTRCRSAVVDERRHVSRRQRWSGDQNSCCPAI